MCVLYARSLACLPVITPREVFVIDSTCAVLANLPQVVAYLDTGAGKTFIAVLLFRHRLEVHRAAVDEAARLGAPPPPRWLGLFLAPQVSLVHQQATVLARHLNVRVDSFIGQETDHWKPDE